MQESKQPEKGEVGKPGWLQVLTIVFFLFYMLIPIIATYIFSVATRWDKTILPEGYTLEGYTEVAKNPYFLITLKNSLVLSVLSVVLNLVLIVPTVYWVHVHLHAAKPLLDLLMILPFGIPGVVLALSLVQVYNFQPIHRSPFLLAAATVIFTMPYMYRSVSNNIEAIDIPTLTEAAQSLGANMVNVLTRVIIPNIFPGILSGSLLVFATVFAEFTLARLIVGASFKTFPMLLVEYTRKDGTIAAGLSVISFTIAWIVSLLILWVSGKGIKSTSDVIKAR
ncbi:MAG TPA: ABC transporter permease subunit [Anaerolineaceae bacterium]|nr:ABC transporter permease subunit [Anaerolineaceae bacterium]